VANIKIEEEDQWTPSAPPNKTRVMYSDVARYTKKKDTSLAEIKRAAAQHKAFMKADAKRREVKYREIPPAPNEDEE
jgi:hypothetical protein